MERLIGVSVLLSKILVLNAIDYLASDVTFHTLPASVIPVSGAQIFTRGSALLFFHM